MLYPVVHAVLPPLFKAIWRPVVEGLEHIPAEGPVILASNHLSFADSVVIPVVVPRKVVFMAKSDYFTGPGLKGRAIKAWFEMLDIDRKSTRLNSSHANISYAVFCLKKKKIRHMQFQPHEINKTHVYSVKHQH